MCSSSLGVIIILGPLVMEVISVGRVLGVAGVIESRCNVPLNVCMHLLDGVQS